MRPILTNNVPYQRIATTESEIRVRLSPVGARCVPDAGRRADDGAAHGDWSTINEGSVPGTAPRLCEPYQGCWDRRVPDRLRVCQCPRLPARAQSASASTGFGASEGVSGGSETDGVDVIDSSGAVVASPGGPTGSQTSAVAPSARPPPQRRHHRRWFRGLRW